MCRVREERGLHEDISKNPGHLDLARTGGISGRSDWCRKPGECARAGGVANSYLDSERDTNPHEYADDDCYADANEYADAEQNRDAHADSYIHGHPYVYCDAQRTFDAGASRHGNTRCRRRRTHNKAPEDWRWRGRRR